MNVGNPVPGGLTFRELCATIRTIMSETEVIGVDIVELCADTTESSSYTAAKLLYKILAYWYEKRG
jgi:arginase family enzyme